MRFPVSFSQQRLWFLDQLMPDEPTFNMPYAIWLDGQVDVDALQRAMDAVVARHAVLRTSVVAIDGVPEQVVADSARVIIDRVPVPGGLDAAERTRRAESIAAELAKRPFELARGPLMRAALIDASGGTHGNTHGNTHGDTPARDAGRGRSLFVLVIHHIVSDGRSVEILFDELSALYRAEVTGAAASLERLWMDYGDYAVWQRDRLRGEELERQLGYWREQLRGAPQLLALPTDRPRSATPSAGGALAGVPIDPTTIRRLSEVAHRSNATIFMALLAGYAVVLSRYAGQSDLVIGTPAAGRIRAELEPIAGMFTDILAVRVSVAGEPTFAELLGRVRDVTVEALSHEELPFEILVADLRPARTLSHGPLVQALFAQQSLVAPALDLPGVTACGRVLSTGTAKADVSLYADTSEQEPSLVLEYSTALFDAPFANRLLRSLATVLDRAAAAPETPIAELPLLPPDELAALITRPATGPLTTPVEPTDVRPPLLASASTVTAGGHTVPMAQVCDRAARIGRVLADRGVGPETAVGLCLGRGAGMLSALLGVWWAGGAYVPLDPEFPSARLAAMARDAGVGIVLTDQARSELARSVGGDVLVIAIDDPAIAAAAPLDPVPISADGLAYTIFTSGSTGRPKGVDIEHRAVANLLASFRRLLGLGAGDRFVAITTLSFDMALVELLLPPLCGADLVIASPEQARESDQLRSLIERSAVTAMQATPQTWRMLESAGGVPDSLRLRLCGGETLPRDLADALTPAAAGGVPDDTAEVWNLYGPTETTVWSAAGPVTPGTGPVEIGPAIDNTSVYVLDERMKPVPVGVVGEVYIGGLGLSRGYRGQPRRTAEAFRPDPLGDRPGARLYRTGDLGRWRESGGLELLGRTDHQVKIRGFRIECGEIEAVLRGHRAIRQAAVVSASRAGEPTLVGYVVPRPGGPAARPGADLVELLRPHLRASLPEYMIPSLVVALPALPLTPTGKVDRAALQQPDWQAPDWQPRPSAGMVAPRNPLEATLAGIWADLLATAGPIGVHDNLFDLGGHSLTATRFVARVADTYGVNLPVHHVFATPTVAELAETIAANPEFRRPEDAGRDARLASLTDDELDDLLRAALAQRNRRRAVTGDPLGDMP